MNVSNNSECSSGWTMYWNELSNSTSDLYTADFDTQSELGYYQQQQQEGDEDLSMVSDASSAAPPHLKHAALPEDIKKKSKNKITRKQKETRPDYNKKQNHHSFCLDDTATSSIFHFSQDNVGDHHESVEHVPGFSSQDEPKPKKQLGFFKSCTKGKSGSLMGRKRQ